MNYLEAWKVLDDLQFFKIKLGLESMTRFMDRLGHPQATLPCLHIAGTNGKGSVVATLLAVLSRAGYRVGAYTSPHLSSVRERFRINGEFISEEAFARHAGRIVQCLAGDQITYFEFATALAFLWFAEQEVDFVLLEVGMGGRLDATNIVIPLLSIITNIAFDHQAYLGTTLAAIAEEKAGIIKPGVPVVSGVKGAEALAVIRRLAAEAHAPLLTLGKDFYLGRGAMVEGGLTYQGPDRRYGGLSLGLCGGYQWDNTAVALAAIEVLGDKASLVSEGVIREALPEVRWPGRLELLADCHWGGEVRDVLLDGAHNPDGVAALTLALETGFPRQRLIMVWASMGDKDFSSCLAAIAPVCHRLILTRPESSRSATPDQLLNSLSLGQREKCLTSVSVLDALNQAYHLTGRDDLICVAGSLYLVGKARSLLVGDLVGG